MHPPPAPPIAGHGLVWPAIWAGAVLAVAVHSAFIILSLALGLAYVRPDQPTTFAPAAQLFLAGFVGSGFIASAAGGWLVGRIAACRTLQGLALHGLGMWAITSVLATGLILLALAAGGLAWGWMPSSLHALPASTAPVSSGALLLVGLMVGCLIAAVTGVRHGSRSPADRHSA